MLRATRVPWRVDPLPTEARFFVVFRRLLQRCLQLVNWKIAAMHLTECNGLFSNFVVSEKSIQMFHHFVTHPFWKDVHEERSEQFRVETDLVIGR